MKKAFVFASVFSLLMCIGQVLSYGDEHGTDTVEYSEDRGKDPWVVDIEEITTQNTHFRAAKWTGDNLQMTLMSIPVGGHIGGEKHSFTDQFIRVESGTARVLMGDSAENITFNEEVSDDWAIFVPAGSWHNLINTGKTDVKVYTIYSPPEHPESTLHLTFEDSEEAHQ
ncbi:MAG: cupin domain-containing protein [Candidatus Omnitrophota bacterium]